VAVDIKCTELPFLPVCFLTPLQQTINIEVTAILTFQDKLPSLYSQRRWRWHVAADATQYTALHLDIH
jgi:hypothetical protein